MVNGFVYYRGLRRLAFNGIGVFSICRYKYSANWGRACEISLPRGDAKMMQERLSQYGARVHLPHDIRLARLVFDEILGMPNSIKEHPNKHE